MELMDLKQEAIESARRSETRSDIIDIAQTTKDSFEKCQRRRKKCMKKYTI